MADIFDHFGVFLNHSCHTVANPSVRVRSGQHLTFWQLRHLRRLRHFFATIDVEGLLIFILFSSRSMQESRMVCKSYDFATIKKEIAKISSILTNIHIFLPKKQ
jgi:hypothetical protein